METPGTAGFDIADDVILSLIVSLPVKHVHCHFSAITATEQRGSVQLLSTIDDCDLTNCGSHGDSRVQCGHINSETVMKLGDY